MFRNHIKKLILLVFFTTYGTVCNAKTVDCCGDHYRNFTGIHCIGYDYKEYLPDISCSKYVLLAERVADGLLDGTFCNVNLTWDKGVMETLTVMCENDPVPKFVMYLFPVSIILLISTVLIYLKTGSHKTGQDIATIIMSLCLATVMILRIAYLLNLDSDTFYALDEYLGKFALIAYFAWLNVLMAQILIKLIYDSTVAIASTVSHLYGWIIPTFVLWLNCVKAFGDYSTDYLNREWYYKYLPISFLWCINFALFLVLTFNIVIRQLNNCPAISAQNGWCQFLRLLLFASIWFTWIFEILSAKYPDTYPELWKIMDIINSLHGAIIFVVMVLFRKSIFSKISCRSQQWSTFKDSSSSERNYNEHYFTNNLIISVPSKLDLVKSS